MRRRNRLAALETRLRRLECELDIRDTIMRYGCGVDAGDGQAAASSFLAEGVYDSDLGHFESAAEIAAFIDSPDRGHRHHRTAHLVGPLIISLDDDLRNAVVVGHSIVLSRSDEGPSLDRLGVNRWELVQRDGRWRCASRTLRPVGHPDAAGLLTPALTAPAPRAPTAADRP